MLGPRAWPAVQPGYEESSADPTAGFCAPYADTSLQVYIGQAFSKHLRTHWKREVRRAPWGLAFGLALAVRPTGAAEVSRVNGAPQARPAPAGCEAPLRLE